jgi:hypothetical protein
MQNASNSSSRTIWELFLFLSLFAGFGSRVVVTRKQKLAAVVLIGQR